MDEKYDAIVLGTGLTECVISGLLSVNGRKVLHMDRNDYYGGASASLNLKQLFEQLKEGSEVPDRLGSSRDYNVDIVPKFVMASGRLVRILAHTRVTRYLDFLLVDGSYVSKKKKVRKVPATDSEAMRSGLLGLLEKNRCRKFFAYMQDYEEDDPKTHRSRDLFKMSMIDLYKEFSLSEGTWEFIGHTIALRLNDDYLSKPAIDTVRKIKLYHESLERYGSSPYIYPLYGLGELPQAFARLSAVYGGTYMLAKPVEKIEYSPEEGEYPYGVTSEGETARAKIVVGDPSYFPDRVKKTGQVVRCICLLSHPVDNTDSCKALQIIIPQNQVGRSNDIYISIISGHFKVCPDGMWLAIISTKVETTDPESEVIPGLELLGLIEEKFFSIVDTYEPDSDGVEDKCFMSMSYDATTHFESTSNDILDLYRRITGEELDWSSLPLQTEEDE